MSAHDETHHHDDHHDDGHDHGTYRSYLTGFIISAVLTIIPFAMVMMGDFSSTLNIAVIVGFAVVQIVVQMIYFLHLHPKSEGGWNLLAFLFTAIILVIVISGSLWVMHHLDSNMMPAHDMEAMGQAASPGIGG
ncbi:cytochrome o ubiquinol oxidase subunit IV [Brevundimonas kwangchunensis]|uniref:Cytochrome bo(3) ubiquinol oxidase subunit 4 n=1 Tax=Brevundimonas kwangchunensis TaxID=322163 RepID=A0ABN1H2R8_9CAUL